MRGLFACLCLLSACVVSLPGNTAEFEIRLSGLVDSFNVHAPASGAPIPSTGMTGVGDILEFSATFNNPFKVPGDMFDGRIWRASDYDWSITVGGFEVSNGQATEHVDMYPTAFTDHTQLDFFVSGFGDAPTLSNPIVIFLANILDSPSPDQRPQDLLSALIQLEDLQESNPISRFELQIDEGHSDAAIFILNGSFTSFEVTGPGANLDQVSAVPIPAAFPLLATGLAGIGLMGWRKRNKTQ